MSPSGGTMSGFSDEERGTPVPVRRLAAMAAIALLLGAIALVSVLPGLAPPVPAQRGEKLLSFDPKLARYVDIQSREGWPYSFKREDKTWFLQTKTGKVEVPADRLDGFLETLAGLTRLVEIDEPGLAASDFGLAPPRAVVTVRDGNYHSLAIGDRNPPLTALYVQILPDTSKIVLVGAVLLWEFDKLVALTKTVSVEP